MAEVTLTQGNFDEEVLKCDKTVLVDFWAPWCGPCKMMAPVLAEIAEERPDVKVCKVNIDDAPSLANTYGVMSIPTLMVFKNGQEKDTRIGVTPKDAVLRML